MHKQTAVKRFRTFCDETTLHGWRYIGLQNSFCHCHVFIWFVVVGAMSGLGIGFVISNTEEYINSGLQTNIETTTASLQDVYFPAITVCNINQVEASFLRQIDIGRNLSQMNALYDEYITGHAQQHLEPEADAMLQTIQWLKTVDLKRNTSITDFTRQYCENLFVQVEYDGTGMYWREMKLKSVGPFLYGTDYGACCYFCPQVDLKVWPSSATYVQVSLF